jgi:SPRY domain
MLVCNVSLQIPRTISADIAEAGAAAALATGHIVSTFVDIIETADATATTAAEGNVYPTLVDDPAFASDQVDAKRGEYMVEAASAADTITCGFVSTRTIGETATASDTSAATVTAASVTWDSGTVASVTLSGGNLIATNTATTSTSQGAHDNSAGKGSGKYYFEMKFTTVTGGNNTGVSIGTTTSTYSAMGTTGTTGVMTYRASGQIWNGSNSGSSLGARSAGDVIGIAIDLDNRRAWFRVAPSGNWNGSGTANPATNTGGVTIAVGTMIAFCTFGGTGGVANNVVTANFGASAFTGTAPSGFTSGWPP